MEQTISIALQEGAEASVITVTDEMIRREHIKHEASVKSIGVLYYIGGVIGFIAGVISFAGGISGRIWC